MMEEGFDTGLSMPIRDLIDEWESRLVIGIWLGVEVVENKPLLVNKKYDGCVDGGNAE